MTIPMLQTKVHEVFRRLHEKGYFEGSYYCDCEGMEVYGALGNRNETQECDENTVYFIGSIDKTIAAILVLLAIEEGKLGWDHPVQAYVPLKADYTIRDLCQQTTGIYDVVNDDSLIGKYRTIEDLCRIVEAKESENPHTGQFSYCTTNYVLIWEILAKVYGKNADDLIREKIGSRLPISSIGHGEAIAQSGNFALSSDFDELIHYSKAVREIPGAAPMFASALDLGRILRGLENGKLVSAASLREMNSRNVAAYESMWYGFGMFVMESGWIGHGGSAGNYRSAISYDPIYQLTLARCSRIANPPESEPLSEFILEEIRNIIR